MSGKEDEPTPEQLQQWSQEWREAREKPAVRQANTGYWIRTAIYLVGAALIAVAVVGALLNN